jgi:hypothetical protein
MVGQWSARFTKFDNQQLLNMLRSKPISFIGEHTAEYFIVPSMIEILSIRFDKVIPFYYWSDREGSTLGHECGVEMEVLLIAAFPRRPKVKYPNQEEITVKFNKLLFEAAGVGKQLGVPVFAGVPVVSSFLHLVRGTKVAWFKLSGSDNSTLELQCTLQTEMLDVRFENVTDVISGPLNQTEMLEEIGRAEILNWSDMLEAARAIRYASIKRSHFWLGGRYKPVFWVAIESLHRAT